MDKNKKRIYAKSIIALVLSLMLVTCGGYATTHREYVDGGWVKLAHQVDGMPEYVTFMYGVPIYGTDVNGRSIYFGDKRLFTENVLIHRNGGIIY